MPYAKCPVCQSVFHIGISMPQEQWFQIYYPQCQIGDLVPAECPGCWIELKRGQRVRIRAVPAELVGRVEIGMEGTVMSTDEELEVRSYTVKIQPAGATPITGKFPRKALTYIFGTRD
jgi:hypothetical protein